MNQSVTFHAEIYNELYRRGFLPGNIASNTAIWNTWVAENYPGLPVNRQHQLMARVQVNRIASVLWELNGKIGSESDYLFIAWQGLTNAYGDALEGQEAIPSDTDLNNMQNDYLNNVEAFDDTSPFKGC